MGVLLVDFFRLFGRSLNNEDVGISCADGGYFFNKVDTEKDQPQRSYMLSVEDPADPENDLCRGSWNFIKVAAGIHNSGICTLDSILHKAVILSSDWGCECALGKVCSPALPQP